MDIAQMDLFRMLQVGQSLPSTVTHIMHEHVRSLQQCVEILQQEYEATDSEFRYCKGLLAPIRALPCELLMHIFMLVGDTSTSPDGARVAIGRVCRHWLSITTSFPVLWRKIDIYYSPSFEFKGRVANPKVLQRCLVLSHPRLLDISLDIHSEDPEEATTNLDFFQSTLLEKSLDLLRGHVSRFRSFKFIGPGEGIDLVSTMLSDQTLQKLETLDLQCRGTQNHDMRLPPLLAPALNTVALNFLSYHRDPSVRLITTYSGIFENDQDLYSFLHAAINLKNLDIMHIRSVPHVAATSLQVPPLGFTLQVLTNLQKISIRPCSITTVFQYFKFPNLERLTVPYILNDPHPMHCLGAETPQTGIIIHDLIQRSQCSLRAFEIGSYVWTTKCLPLFQLCASTLTALHIDFYEDSEEDILPSVEMLTVPQIVDGVPQVEHLLPHLTDLTIMVCSSSTEHMLFRLGETEKMVRSRVGGVSPLKRLRLEGKVYPVGMTDVGLRASSLVIVLRNYKREGFDVTWIVAGDDMLKERLE